MALGRKPAQNPLSLSFPRPKSAQSAARSRAAALLSLSAADRWGPSVRPVFLLAPPPPPETLAQAAAVSFQIRPFLSFSGEIFRGEMIFSISSSFSLLESSPNFVWKSVDSRSNRIPLFPPNPRSFLLVAGRRGPSPPSPSPFKRTPELSSTRRHPRLRLSSSVAP